MSDKKSETAVIRQLYKNFSNMRNKNFIQQAFFNIHIQEGNVIADSEQIGYLEKIAAGTLKFYEPLTTLDIMRVVAGLKESLRVQKKETDPNIDVIKLNSIQLLTENYLQGVDYAVIDFNLDPNDKTPKWGVWDRKTNTVFCEALLSEQEKRVLEMKLQKITAEKINYIGGHTEGNLSSGPMALAYLDSQLGTQQMSLETDFFTLRHRFLSLMVPEGVRFKFPHQEAKYTTEAFKKYVGLHYESTDGTEKNFLYERRRHAGYAYNKFSKIQDDPETLEINNENLTALSRVADFGVLGGSIAVFIFDNNNIVECLNTLYQKDSGGGLFFSVRGYTVFSDFLSVSNKRCARTINPALWNTLNLYRDQEGTTASSILFNHDASSASLHITDEKWPVEQFKTNYEQQCQNMQYNNSNWEDLWRYRIGGTKFTDEDEIAAALVLSVFRNSYRKKSISIGLPPAFNFTPADDSKNVRYWMNENPNVTEFIVIGDNKDLLSLKEQLRPVLARNKLLELCDYHPPLFDNYWQAASKKFIYYLADHHDIAAPGSHDTFKESLIEMGMEGLTNILSYLDANKEEIEQFLEGRKLTFYGSGNQKRYDAYGRLITDAKSYMATLTEHIRNNRYFPFNQVCLFFSDVNLTDLQDFLDTANESKTLEKVILENVTAKPELFLEFATKAMQRAKEEQWQQLISIPELDDLSKINEQNKSLYHAYALLNNTILKNIREHAANKVIPDIKEGLLSGPGLLPSEERDEQTNTQETAQSSLPVSEDAIDRQWPLDSAESTQVQFQHQQAVESQLQITRDVGVILTRKYEGSRLLPNELISYDNINEKLGEFYKTLTDKNGLDANVDSLSQPASSSDSSKPVTTDLQEIFEHWISARPNVDSPHTIRFFTDKAAKTLLRKNRSITSGLNPENLPKGFYTLRNKEGQLVLCYNEELGYLTKNNFTIDLDETKAEASLWLGDFRQFHPEHYSADSLELNEQVIKDILIFISLQPSLHTGDASPSREEMIRASLYQFIGPEAVEFYEKLKTDISKEEIIEVLLPESHPKIIPWLQKTGLLENENFMQGIGQVYYQYGTSGTELLVSQLQLMALTLGDEFFDNFKHHFLEKNNNYSPYISKKMFSSLQEMMHDCRADPNRSKAWQVICDKHMMAMGWEQLPALWTGFNCFYQDVQSFISKSQVDEMAKIKPGNMLVVMERIAACLEQLPDPQQKKRFLSRISDYDLEHGGVFHALQYEDFYLVDKSLQLSGFENGTPTYKPRIREIYDTALPTIDAANLYLRRALAIKSMFNYADYQMLCQWLTTKENVETKKAILVLLKLSIFHFEQDKNSPVSVDSIINLFDKAHPKAMIEIAKTLHAVIYRNPSMKSRIEVQLDTLLALADKDHLAIINQLEALTALEKKSILEIIDILYQSGRQQELSLIFEHYKTKVIESSMSENENYQLCFKLWAAFGKEEGGLEILWKELNTGSNAAIARKKSLLYDLQLIDWKKTGSNPFIAEGRAWAELVETMKQLTTEVDGTDLSESFINRLQKEHGVIFKTVVKNDYYLLSEHERKGLNRLRHFVDHKQRVWDFLQKHVAIPVGEDSKQALHALFNFMVKLQLKQTQLNELEPLLSLMEKTESGHYWDVHYLTRLLESLNPKDDKSSYPFSLLEAILSHSQCAAKPLEDLSSTFPKPLHNIVQEIIHNSQFNRKQQRFLCELALREFDIESDNWPLTRAIIATLGKEQYSNQLKGSVLSMLLKSNTVEHLEVNWKDCQSILQLGDKFNDRNNCWNQTLAYWLSQLHKADVRNLFNTIMEPAIPAPIVSQPQSLPKGKGRLKRKNKENTNTDQSALHEQRRIALLVHICGWSLFHEGTGKKTENVASISHKLLSALNKLNLNELNQLAAYYPQNPCPSADDIIKAVDAYQKGIQSWSYYLIQFERDSNHQKGRDQGYLTEERLNDFARMVQETRLSAVGSPEKGGASSSSSTPDDNPQVQKSMMELAQAAELGAVFSCLKEIEVGQIKLLPLVVPIQKMSQNELCDSFSKFSEELKNNPKSHQTRAILWAILFETMGRTTGKYPHLAQQFSIIANDICLSSKMRIMQLATGEGKSHFAALRAAFHAGQGKSVDVITAKRTLASRDHSDYQAFFSYLGLNSSFITAKSKRETYTQSQIHYSTQGDISLFLDQLAYNGTPLEIERGSRIALFDEFDYIQFEEDQKTQYNFAVPTGRTPKEMMWFYQAMNQYYKEHFHQQKTHVSDNDLPALIEHLNSLAEGDERKQKILEDLTAPPIKLVQWLKAAHCAKKLSRDMDYTVRHKNVQIGDETYPMQVIIPLSSDNQAMVGSSFSNGVHQLLAVILNEQAKHRNEPQNFMIPEESNIISSQLSSRRTAELWGQCEGFSGTISPAQIYQMDKQYGVQVLHVPTNETCRRNWQEPKLYESEDERYDAILTEIQDCFEKQESILFACKNDKKVKELQRALLKRCNDPKILDYLMFYTNEDARSPEDVFREKKDKEQWSEGAKSRGVGLVASCFGRGDNAGVEHVILLDVNDENDRLQKGGRTARNGKAGTVHQFYLSQELQKEKQQLEARLSELIDDENFKQVISQLQLNSDDLSLGKLALHQQVLALREHVNQFSNAAQHGYKELLADYSSWGMAIIVQLAMKNDLGNFNRFYLRWNNSLKDIEKAWVNLSVETKVARNAETKIAEIKASIVQISKQVGEFLTANNINVPHFQAFKANNTVPAEEKLVLAHEQLSDSRAMVTAARLLPPTKVSTETMETIAKMLGNIKAGVTDEELLKIRQTLEDEYDSADVMTYQIYLENEALKQLSEEKKSSAFKSYPAVIKQFKQDDKLHLFNDLFEKSMQEYPDDFTDLIFRLAQFGALAAFYKTLEAALKSDLSNESVLKILTKTLDLNVVELSSAEDFLPNLIDVLSKRPDFVDIFNRYVDAIRHSADNHLKISILSKVLVILRDSESSNNQEQLSDFLLNIDMPHDNKLALLNFFHENKYVDRHSIDELKHYAQIINGFGSLDTVEFMKRLKQYNEIMVLFAKFKPNAALNNFKVCLDWYKERTTTLDENAWHLHNALRDKIIIENDFIEIVKNAPEDNTKINIILKMDRESILLPFQGKSHSCFKLFALHKQYESTVFADIKGLEQLDALIRILKVEPFEKLDVAKIYAEMGSQHQLHKNPLFQEGLKKLCEKTPFNIQLLTLLRDSLNGENFDPTLFSKHTVIDAIFNILSHDNLDDKEKKTLLESMLVNANNNIATAEFIANTYTLCIRHMTAFYQPNNRNEFSKNNRPSAIALISPLSLGVQVNNSEVSIDLDYIKEVFANFSKENYNQRVILMRVLYNSILAPRQAQSSLKVLTDAKNQETLQHCFDLYVNHTKSVLGDWNQNEASVESDKGLNKTQYRHLMSLSGEIKEIVLSSNIQNNPVVQQSNTLEADINKLERLYDSSWFKSGARKDNFKRLKRELEEVLNPNSISLENTRYETLLTVIQKQIIESMKQDIRDNETRTIRPMVNKKGYSRYLNTLNQMYDVVLRHWSQDNTATASFARYKQQALSNAQSVFDIVLEYVENSKNKNIPDDKGLFNDFNFSESSTHSSIKNDLKNLLSKQEVPGHLKTMITQALIPLKRLGDEDMDNHPGNNSQSHR